VASLNERRMPWSKESTASRDFNLQQLAPYIGRMKTSMARSLIGSRTREGDLIVDPFCGSGVVALEAAAMQRRVVAGDWNPYAILLTRAKLFPPRSLAAAETRLRKTWQLALERVPDQDLRSVPRWVRNFFHPQTLREALAFRDACVEAGDEFLLASLLGILHHQRPGFLSFPSSHLVPYLRQKKFPREIYPELYEAREVLPRLAAKVRRTFKRQTPPFSESRKVVEGDAQQFPRVRDIQAVITSPPYMNELDYVRDNRLRLWFINKRLPEGLDVRGPNRAEAYRSLLQRVAERLAPNVASGGFFMLIVGDVTRGVRQRVRTSNITEEVFASSPRLDAFRLTARYEDEIPDIRRSRRECRGTKRETVLVYCKR
jgi:hypothetical protein